MKNDMTIDNPKTGQQNNFMTGHADNDKMKT